MNTVPEPVEAAVNNTLNAAEVAATNPTPSNINAVAVAAEKAKEVNATLGGRRKTRRNRKGKKARKTHKGKKSQKGGKKSKKHGKKAKKAKKTRRHSRK